jgi:hypothetical protein
MKIAVHHSSGMDKGSFSWKWIEELEKRHVEVMACDFFSPNIIQEVAGCRGAMWHCRLPFRDRQAAPKILQAIQLCMGIPVFPDMRTFWHYDEKVAQYYLLQAADAPALRTWVFWDLRQALDYAAECAFPIIVKLSTGAASQNVLKVDSRRELERIARRLFGRGIRPGRHNESAPIIIPKSLRELRVMKSRTAMTVKHRLLGDESCKPVYYPLQKDYLYVQEFMPNNSYDIRITIIGNRAFGFIRHNREDDFRASGSGRIDYDLSNVPMEAVEIAQRISARCGFQSMAYDFLRSPKGELLINEISYCYANRAVYDCPGHWDDKLEWHAGHMWPEEAQVEDFLDMVLETAV